jgi:hypothetical protein
VEIKQGQDPFADPWEAARVDKKQKVARNQKNQAKNQERVAKSKGKTGLPQFFGALCLSASVFFIPALLLALRCAVCTLTLLPPLLS